MQPLLLYKSNKFYIFRGRVCSLAMRTRHIVFGGHPAVHCFSTLSHKRHDFEKEKQLNIKNGILILFTKRLSKLFLFLRRIGREMLNNVCWSLCKVPVILVRFWWNLNLLDRFSKNTHIKRHENPSSGSLGVPCGRTGRSKQSVFAILRTCQNFYHSFGINDRWTYVRHLEHGCERGLWACSVRTDRAS